MSRLLTRAAGPAREVRLVRLANRLRQGVPVSHSELEDELEVSRATLTRDIALLRDQLNMPIVFDKESGGYLIADAHTMYGPRYELPGIWLSGPQAWGVLTLVNVVSTIDPGFLREPLMPLRGMLKGIVRMNFDRPPPVEDKLAIEIAYRDECDPDVFRFLSAALYKEKMARLSFSENRIPATRYSLQRFALTREGWFIDAYDPRAGELLRIPVRMISAVEILERSAILLTRHRDYEDSDDLSGDGKAGRRVVSIWYDADGNEVFQRAIAP